MRAPSTCADARWRWRSWPVVLLAACGAGAAVVPPHAAPPLGLGEVHEGAGQGPDLALISRPSGGLLRLALWIDAGARDAVAPEVATLAAWLAAQEAGADVAGKVWPDGTQLALTCQRPQLDGCLRRLARGLGLRAPDAPRMQDALHRLAAAQRLAWASDPERDADRLALRTLFDPRAADAFFPLGQSTGGDTPTSAQVQAFLSAHYGPQRALLIAAGDVTAEVLAHAAAEAFAKAKPATAKRAEVRAGTSTSVRVGLSVADRDAVSVAVVASDLADAHAAAWALEERLQRAGLAAPIHGDVFPVRGGALALLRVAPRDRAAVVRTLSSEFARLRAEGTPEVAAPPGAEGLDALTTRLGARWATQAKAEHWHGLAMGIGVLVRGGRADHTALADPDAPLREHAQAEMDAAVRAGLEHGQPSLTGPIDAHAASVTLSNGASIELRQRAGEQVAVAVEFAPGAAADAPLLHGRAALLATLTTTACAGMQAGELQARLRALGASLEPEVSADAWGILLTAPATRWRDAVALSLDCALRPQLDRATLSIARLRLLQRLGAKDGPAALLASVANALWPAAPGTLAPWGSRVRLASVSLASVRELSHASLTAGVARLAVVGPIEIEQAAGLAGRRLAELPSTSSGGADPKQAADEVHAVVDAQAPQTTLGLAVVRATVPGGHRAGAGAYAALLRAALGKLPGITPVWHAGGLVKDTGWAAVALVGAPEAVAAAAAALPATASGLPEDSLDRATDQAFELAIRVQSEAQAEPTTEACDLAAQAKRPTVPPLREAARALARHLARETPVWLPLP